MHTPLIPFVRPVVVGFLFRTHLVCCFLSRMVGLSSSFLSIGPCKAQNLLIIDDGLTFSSHDFGLHDLCLLVVWSFEGFLVFDHVACALE